MTKYAYVVHQLAASRKNKPTEGKILSDIGGFEGGLIDILTKILDEKRGEVDCNEGSESAHRVESSFTQGNSIMIEGMVGSYGISGKALHLDTGDERPFYSRTANTNPIRVQLFVPVDEREALIFCERVSRRTLKTAMEKGVFRIIEKNYRVNFTISSHVDKKASEKFLQDGKVGCITAIYKSTRAEDVSPRRGKSQDLHISVVEQLPGDLDGHSRIS